MLKNKNILILVSGSIAIYKTLDLISSLKKMKANIKVVMSEDATKFINPLCFESLSNNEVLCVQNERFLQSSPNHISYASFADIALLAPASVNSIAKLCYGVADTLVIETLLACKCPILVAPSANINMLETKQNKENLKKLQNLGYTIIPPRESLLACNITAKGAMASIEEIIFHIKKALYQNGWWRDKNIIITGGGSIEDIDSIRCISNHSSGKQSSNIAIALYFLGAKVTLISSRFPLPLPLGIKKIEVKSSLDFKNAIKKELKKDSILFMAAAISDYIPKTKLKTKLKKEALGKTWNLDLVQNEDILRDLKCALKIGFKAESDRKNAPKFAKKLLDSTSNGGKGCDMVILNIIDSANQIGGSSNEISIFSKNNYANFKKQDKFSISLEIAKFIQNNA
ncbi:MAG: bifunctional phosphopantothenoylcysteine decarboxylase/phosphopantothenate--cysteine ligase CoaBC [Helicobacteraceae bacterium]|nr:bifunctional phosphopantothenoylcysteine decarboxylase/phosphopantothenate--cysteine ligase CoaBC [Helicobacteraceae bacterium]